MNFFKTKTEIKGRGSVLNCEAGFTMTEVVVVMAIMSVLIGIGYTQLRTPKEKIACKEIFSNLQLAKLQAVSTGADKTVDVDADLDAVENVDVPEEVDYLTVQPASLAWGVSVPWPANGIDFDAAGGTVVTFTSKGMTDDSGSVYLKYVDNTSRLCAVSVLNTGIVRMSTSVDGGANWN